MKQLMLMLATLAVASVSAATSYKVTLFQPSLLAGKELQPGVYKVELKEGTAVLRKGKDTVEAPVRTETAESKFGSTSVRYKNGDGKYRIEEIRFGGTNQKIVFAN
jgi:hypothetical protein